MNIFIVGLPKSGKTTLSKALSKDGTYQHIDSSSWIKSTFRDKREDEHIEQYEEAYCQFFINRMKIDPHLCIKNIEDTMASYSNSKFIIDGLVGPKDFIQLFDYSKDVVIFLNRIDGDVEYKDYQSIGISVMRDYCFWLAAAGLLAKSKWIEYNFRIPGELDDHVKVLGSKNTVYLVKSLDKVISHFQERLLNLQGQE